ncbi:uncharacterized protein LOC135820044 isoform X1 [Sycon ciliatum]|uniref:uncharacterized protein LOC135820044 isoform X1 n=1 Tax=Sycon ciliatum TaxID=27933 RepID=UPI0031F65EBB
MPLALRRLVIYLLPLHRQAKPTPAVDGDYLVPTDTGAAVKRGSLVVGDMNPPASKRGAVESVCYEQFDDDQLPLVAAEQPPNISRAGSLRAPVESVCYEAFAEDEILSPPAAGSSSSAGPAMPAVVEAQAYENLAEPNPAASPRLSIPPPPTAPPPPSSLPPPPTQPPPPSSPPPSAVPPPPSFPPPPENSGIAIGNYENLADPPVPAGRGSDIPVGNYENFADPQPPPSNSGGAPGAIATTNYENFEVAAPASVGGKTVDSSRGAVASICYENIGDQEKSASTAAVVRAPVSEDPFDYREPAAAAASTSKQNAHLSMYENPEDYSEATLRKARESSAPSTVASPQAVDSVKEGDTLPSSVSGYQAMQEGLDAGMSDVSMRSRTVTITAVM